MPAVQVPSYTISLPLAEETMKLHFLLIIPFFYIIGSLHMHLSFTKQYISSFVNFELYKSILYVFFCHLIFAKILFLKVIHIQMYRYHPLILCYIEFHSRCVTTYLFYCQLLWFYKQCLCECSGTSHLGIYRIPWLWSMLTINVTRLCQIVFLGACTILL